MELLPAHDISIEVNSMIQRIMVDRQNVVASKAEAEDKSFMAHKAEAY
jgi:hypothetical protein